MKSTLESLEDLRDECAAMLQKGVNYNRSAGNGDHPRVQSMCAALASNHLPDMIEVLREFVTYSESLERNRVIRDVQAETEFIQAKMLIERYLRTTKTMKTTKARPKNISREIIAPDANGIGAAPDAIIGVGGTEPETTEAPAKLEEIPLGLIEKNPYQPRKTFSQEELDDMAASIREHGVIQPIIVRALAPVGVQQIVTYQLVAGERRWRAAQIAKLERIPAVVRVLDEATMLELAIIENEQRSQVNAIESARSYAKLVELGRKQSEIGARIGKSQPLVANALRLLELPREVQQMIEGGALSASHGVTLCRYAKYPKFVCAYAADIIENKTASKEIEKGIFFKNWSRKNEAKAKGLLEVCYGVQFDVKAARKEYPDAFFDARDDRDDYCLDVPLFNRLQAEAQKKLDDEAAAAAEARKKGDKPDELVKLNTMAYGTYERISGNSCAACTTECPCRLTAIDYGNVTVEICTDPKRRRSLKGAESREKKKVLRVAVAEKSNTIIVESADVDDRAVALAVQETLWQAGEKTVAAVAATLKINFDAAKYFKYDTNTTKRLEMLHELDRDTLLRLVALSVMQKDLQATIDGFSAGKAEWFLKTRRKGDNSMETFPVL